MYVLNELWEYEIYQLLSPAADRKHRKINLDHDFVIMS